MLERRIRDLLGRPQSQALVWRGASARERQHLYRQWVVEDSHARANITGASRFRATERVLASRLELPATRLRSYNFLTTDDRGRPITWDAKHRIPAFLDQTLAPANHAERVLQVFAEVRYLTGITFQITGVGQRDFRDFTRNITANGNHNAHALLITFVPTQEELDRPGPAVATCTTWTHHDEHGRERRFAGLIRCCAAARLPDGFVANGWGGVLRHEVGHLVGLAHVDDPDQVMSTTNRRTADWGLGDRTGLRIVGQASRVVDHVGVPGTTP